MEIKVKKEIIDSVSKKIIEELNLHLKCKAEDTDSIDYWANEVLTKDLHEGNGYAYEIDSLYTRSGKPVVVYFEDEIKLFASVTYLTTKGLLKSSKN